MSRFFALLLALTLLAWPRTSYATAARQLLDPSALFPTPDELPPGFVHYPELDNRLMLDDVIAIIQWWERDNPDVGPDDTTLLQLLGQVAPSNGRAQEVFTDTISVWEGFGFVFEPLDGIGDRGVVGRNSLGEFDERSVEAVLIFFGIGTFNGGVVWGDFADLPNFDYAFDVAQLIEQRTLANRQLLEAPPTQPLPPAPTATVSVPPPATALPVPPEPTRPPAPAPALPAPTLQPEPTQAAASPTAPPPSPVPASGFDPARYLGQGDRYNCGDFRSQADAQAVLRADPSDPNRLDTDRDGIACESNPPPRDLVPVAR